MTTHIVTDDALGTVTRRRWEIERRLMEGTLDPSFVARNLQSIAEGREVSVAPAMAATCPFYANEEVQSNYGYPQGYAVKPIPDQLVVLSKYFPNLDASSALNSSKELPILPPGAEGWFAVPKFEKVGKNYNDATERVLDIIGKTRTLYNYRKGKLSEKYLRLTERTAVALQMLSEKQPGDFLLIPAQFGFSHRGRSVRRVRVVYAPNEFGLGSFIVGCMLIAHPERLVQWGQLHVDCPGDEFAPGAGSVFSEAPFFRFGDSWVSFGSGSVVLAGGRYGSASGLLSQ